MSAKPTFKAVVLGKPIEHSRSPLLHNVGYKALGLQHWVYERMECDAAGLPALLEHLGEEYRGCSVTMPAKFAALDVAQEHTERASVIGSANTLVRIAGGWRADNTDVDGVHGALGELLGAAGLKDAPQRAVIIGAGGTARPALYALAERGVSEVWIVNRSDRAEEFATLQQALGIALHFVPFAELGAVIARADVAVSTIPAAAAEQHADTIASVPVLDVIYDPWPTPLMRAARRQGTACVPGHVMLAEQAYGQFEQFTGHSAPRATMRAALERDLGIHT